MFITIHVDLKCPVIIQNTEYYFSVLKAPVFAKFKKNVTCLFTDKKPAHLIVVLSVIENMELRFVVVHHSHQTSFVPCLFPRLRENSLERLPFWSIPIKSTMALLIFSTKRRIFGTSFITEE
jgi:hypothetical protein